VLSDVMIQLSMVTTAAAAAAGDRARTQQLLSSTLQWRRRVTTKELGGERGPPRHELKPDNETRTRFHRHKATGESGAAGPVN